jgi:hypothetical protein
MKKYFLLSIVVLGIVSLIVWGQTKFSNEYSELVSGSKLIVVGKVLKMSPIVNKIKLEEQKLKHDSLPDPNEYFVGNEFLIEVSEWVKSTPEVKKLGSIRIFTLGRSPKEGDAVLIKDKEFLLFLNPLNIENCENMTSLNFNADGSISQTDFNKTDYFIVNGKEAGAIGEAEKIKNILAKIKSLL